MTTNSLPCSSSQQVEGLDVALDILKHVRATDEFKSWIDDFEQFMEDQGAVKYQDWSWCFNMHYLIITVRREDLVLLLKIRYGDLEADTHEGL